MYDEQGRFQSSERVSCGGWNLGGARGVAWGWGVRGSRAGEFW